MFQLVGWFCLEQVTIVDLFGQGFSLAEAGCVAFMDWNTVNTCSFQ